MNPFDVIIGFSIDARLGNPMMVFVCIARPHLARAREVVPSATMVVPVSFSTPFGFEEGKEGEGRGSLLVPVPSHVSDSKGSERCVGVGVGVGRVARAPPFIVGNKNVNEQTLL